MSSERPVVVIKVGGDVLEAPERLNGLVTNVAELIDGGFARSSCTAAGRR